MVRSEAQTRECDSLRKTASKLQSSITKTWNLAPKTPMFLKKLKEATKDANGNEKAPTKRYNRLISGHAYKLAASGAALHVAALLEREAEDYRIDAPTSSRSFPLLPKVSKGAIALLEQFLCAFAAQGTSNAVAIRTALNPVVVDKHGNEKCAAKRQNRRYVRAGFEQAAADVFGAASPVAKMYTVAAAPSKRKDEADAEYTPPARED
tara:strand:+ start:935 stop:1558 length:624 start_codon:yes stop_codon:yes gene_type:complete